MEFISGVDALMGGFRVNFDVLSGTKRVPQFLTRRLRVLANGLDLRRFASSAPAARLASQKERFTGCRIALACTGNLEV